MRATILIIELIIGLSAVNCFDYFITRNVDKIMEGPKEFRFISFNVPNMAVVEDPGWHSIDPWEQEDVLKTINQIGGRVIRIFTFSIKKYNDKPETKRHVYGINKYDEDLFRNFDKMLELCNKFGVRVIVPFINRFNGDFGGIDDFKAFRNKIHFYQDAQVRQDFKDMITHILNRTNVYTGVKYMDDKAILAWETGNEMNPPFHDWTKEIAAHIKSIDKNHLVMDGNYGIDSSSLSDPNIDIVSNHYYPGSSKTFAERCKADRKLSQGKKAFFAGEFGLAPIKMFFDLLDEVISDGTIGALIWSLRPHNKDGGFYEHREGTTNFHSYHWPGFYENNGYDEINVVNLVRDRAYKIQGKPIPPIPIPEAPYILHTESVHSINWRGSVGARVYDIERTTNPDGEWILIKNNITDIKQIEKEGPLLNDTSVQPGTSYYYRAKAKNIAGASDWSNVIGPIKA
uniref:mannan endo-1,4-beta-mannosidase n=1 Tax=Metopus es TaxID=392813 RepID=A6MI38_9CILI|nr:endo-beta-mannanase [Metopus es]